MRYLLPFILLGCSVPASAGPVLLIGNKGEDTVSFVDLDSGKELRRVETGDMPHEIAISPDGKRAAVVAYAGTTIDIFEVASGKLLQRLDIAPNKRPHGIVWLNDGRIVATTEGSQSLTIVSADLKTVSAVSTGQQGSHMVAIDPKGGRGYIANIGSGTVSVIDVDTGQKLSDITLGGRPEGIALSADGKRLWVGDLAAAVVRVVDTDTQQVIAEIPVDPVAIRVAISPDGKWAVTSNVASGTITVIDTATLKPVKTISVSGTQEAGQVTILFSPDGRRLYAAETGRNQVAEIDMENGTIVRRLPAGQNGDGLAIAP